MAPIAPVPPALTSGIAGYRAAENKMATAAAEIAQTPLRDSVELSGGSPGPDLAGSMVDLRVAKYMAVANLKVIRTAADVEQSVVDELGR